MEKKRHTIGAVAKLGNIRISTLRYYERCGLLSEPIRTDGGFRSYTEDIFERLLFIDNAKKVGMSLKEIAEILSWQKQLSQENFRTKILKKIGQLEEQISSNKEKLQLLSKIQDVCPISQNLSGTCSAHHCPPESCKIVKRLNTLSKSDMVKGDELQELFALLCDTGDQEVYVLNALSGVFFYTSTEANRNSCQAKIAILKLIPPLLKEQSTSISTLTDDARSDQIRIEAKKFTFAQIPFIVAIVTRS